jgi:hypothetical protein
MSLDFFPEMRPKPRYRIYFRPYRVLYVEIGGEFTVWLLWQGVVTACYFFPKGEAGRDMVRTVLRQPLTLDKG